MGLFKQFSDSLHRLRERLRPYLFRAHSSAVLTINDTGVTQEHSDGRTDHIAWDDLREVTILTTDGGPFAEDLFIVLDGNNGQNVVIAQGADKEARLTDRLLRLPGFDHDAFTAAMCCTQNRKFPCWRRQPAEKGEGT